MVPDNCALATTGRSARRHHDVMAGISGRRAVRLLTALAVVCSLALSVLFVVAVDLTPGADATYAAKALAVHAARTPVPSPS